MSTTKKPFSLNRGTSRNRISLRTASATWLLPLVLLWMLPAVGPAQYIYTTNNGTITLSGYTGSDTTVSIPSTVYNLPVTRIGDYTFQAVNTLTSVTIPDSVTSIGSYAFSACAQMTNIAIPNSVTNIGSDAFSACTSLTDITVPNRLTSIGNYTFHFCTSLTSVTIPNSVTNIGYSAFSYCTRLASVAIPNGVVSIGNSAFTACTNLTSVTIPGSVTSIDSYAFASCFSLAGVYFPGNAPSVGLDVFINDDNTTVYYLPGSAGWGTTLGGRPTALWLLPNPLILSLGPNFGVQTNGFGFLISWATNIPVVVEASMTLINPVWSPVNTNTLTAGSFYFSDPQWTNYPVRFYRLRSP